MERELRRRRNELYNLGTGVLAFGLWSVVKTLMYLLLTPPDLKAYTLSPELRNHLALLLVCFILLTTLAELGIRAYIGLSARAEGLGKRRNMTYVVLAFCQVTASLFMSVFFLTQMESAERGRLDTIVSMAVDTSSTIILAEMAFTALKVKKISAGRM